MLDVTLFGLAPAGHHAVSLLLHVLNAVLLALVLFRMTGAWWRSVLVAALFALHPLRVESVAWISERKDVLSGLFFLLTLEAYRRWTARPSRGRYALVALSLALGLTSKPMLVTTPFVLVLLDVWPLGRTRTRSLAGLALEKWPLFLLAAAAAAIAVTLFALCRRWRRSPAAVGWLWYVGMLVPVLGIVQVGMQACADRYTYLPGIGLAIAVTWPLSAWAGTSHPRRAVAAGAAIVVLATLTGATVRQVTAWKDTRTLYHRARAWTRSSAPSARGPRPVRRGAAPDAPPPVGPDDTSSRASATGRDGTPTPAAPRSQSERDLVPGRGPGIALARPLRMSLAR